MKDFNQNERVTNGLIYRPFRVAGIGGSCFSVLCLVGGAAAFLYVGISSGLWLLPVVMICFHFVFFGGLFLWFFCQYHIVVICNDNGITIVNDIGIMARHYPWSVFSHCSYQRNLKGWNYMILSPSELDHDQKKHVLHKVGLVKRMQFDGIVVLEVSETPESLAIQRMICEKIPTVHGELL